MLDSSTYEKPIIPDKNFPIRIGYSTRAENTIAFQSHWHEQIELLYFLKGEAYIECNSIPMRAVPGDLLVVNAHELHYCKSLDAPLEYYCIIIDPAFFKSSFIDACDIKYFTPIHQNHILFDNKISNDSAIADCIEKIVSEQSKKELGYELAIKSHVIWLMVLLLRYHIHTVLTPKEYSLREKNLNRLNQVLKYIEIHYNEDLNVNFFCKMTSLSKFHFCHLFKEATGQTLTEYINGVRINKAEELLKSSSLSITEVALATGFNDSNYFSRVFKKIKMISPTSLRG